MKNKVKTCKENKQFMMKGDTDIKQGRKGEGSIQF